jgi:hypothetical protein
MRQAKIGGKMSDYEKFLQWVASDQGVSDRKEIVTQARWVASWVEAAMDREINTLKDEARLIFYGIRVTITNEKELKEWFNALEDWEETVDAFWRAV